MVRGDLDRVDLGVGALGGGGPVQELTGGGLEGGQAGPLLVVHLGEVAPGVEGVAGAHAVRQAVFARAFGEGEGEVATAHGVVGINGL